MNNIDKIREANARIAELEADLAVANETIADLRDLAYNRAPKLAAEECNRQKAELEARLAEAEIALADRIGHCDHHHGAAAEAARLKLALEKLEWFGYRTHDLRQCPACFNLKREGVHARNCFIAAALRPEQPAESEGK